MRFWDKKKGLLILSLAIGLHIGVSAPYVAYASSAQEETSDSDALVDTSDIDAQIAALESKKKDKQAAAKKQLEDLQAQVADLQEQLRQKNFDAEGAVESLSGQIALLNQQIEEQNTQQQKLLDEISKLKKERDDLLSAPSVDDIYATRSFSTSPSDRYLVNPGPTQSVSYTQDASNSQGNSTMVFAFAPNQLYKIYCRLGFLTDLEFKKGEMLTFVGGGDTSSWMIESATIDGTPHIYVKPVVESSTTNLIVNTDKRSYQIILNTSDWYNPMVKWSYEAEDRISAAKKRRSDEITYTDTMNVTSPDSLNFDYRIKGDAEWKPIMVFDDGKKSYIKFKTMSSQMPILFIREEGHREVALTNYKVKDNFYIVDKVFADAELKGYDGSIVKIERKKA